MLEDFHERQQRSQPDLVIRTADTDFQIVQTRLPPAVPHHRPRDRNLDTQELVPFPILPRPGFEKTGKPRHL